METGTTSSMIYHLKSKHEDIFAMHQFTRDPSLPSYPRKRLDAGHRLPGGADVTDPITGLPIRQVNIIYIRIRVPDPDPPDQHVFEPPRSGSGSISQRYGSGSFYHLAKIVRKTLISNVL
jgi:hypothetical protein